jgi:hypothetical protein
MVLFQQQQMTVSEGDKRCYSMLTQRKPRREENPFRSHAAVPSNLEMWFCCRQSFSM